MNRIEIVGLFSALDELYKMKAYDSMGKIIKNVLDEARTKNPKIRAQEENEEQ